MSFSASSCCTGETETERVNILGGGFGRKRAKGVREAERENETEKDSERERDSPVNINKLCNA